MKFLFSSTALLAVILLFTASACKKDTPSCGCSAASIGVVRDSTGRLEYNTVTGTYQINKSVGDNAVMEDIYWLCNPEQLPDSIKTQYTGKKIRFSGALKPMCPSDYMIAIATVIGQYKLYLTDVSGVKDN